MLNEENAQTYEQEKEASRELLRSLDIDTHRMDEVQPKDALTFSNAMVQDNTLLSTADFSSLLVSEEIKNALYMLGYDRPSLAQLSTIPHILKGQSLLFQSKSGTGKTISFVVGALQNVVKGKGVQVLLITPTMELNRQTTSIFEKVGGPLGIRTFMAMRGERVSLWTRRCWSAHRVLC
ncbi:RNA helicase [Trachipleistophora hominis]|uniref:RNA helicase n=1 Tax=Trachipleistophora hominis TaxID=72359 RepID=L7JY23_TRAHO|nr:RNA helicase [Trachipleistophora hominis]